MKVLYLAPKTLLGQHFRAGWENSFNALGHLFSAMDPFQEDVPGRLKSERFDLIMASSGDELLKLPVDILNAHNTALVINGLPYNAQSISPDIQAPCANSIEVQHIAKFNRKLVWSQWSPAYVDYFFSGYTSRGIPTISLPYAADITQMPETARSLNDIEHKMVFIGNLKHRKRGNIRLIKRLLSLLPREDVLIHGGEDWQRFLNVQASPPVLSSKLAELYRTSLISPNIHTVRQKSHRLQVNDRCFQIPASGGFQICDNLLAYDYFEANEIVIAETVSDFIEKVDYFLHNPDETLPYLKASMNAVRTKHSYFNRIASLFETLNFNADVKLNEIVWLPYNNSRLSHHRSVDLDKVIYYAMESVFMRTARLAKRTIFSIKN